MKDIPDLHEEFIKALHAKIPKKELTGRVADMLLIEKDSAYRRVSGKVAFTTREIGIIADKLNISLDRIMRQNEEFITWLPFVFQSPLKTHSIDCLFDTIDTSLDMISNITENGTEGPVEMGSFCSSFPIELCFYSPPLLKFMFFKWGHNCVGTEEFNHYAEWELPDRVELIFQKMERIYQFDQIYYIWDSSMIWTLVNEINTLHVMGVIKTPERDQIREALKEMMVKSEHSLNGNYTPVYGPDASDFYISNQYMGFTCYYCVCGERHFVAFQSNFNFCVIDDNLETFHKLKDWMDSFKRLSTKLSGSGRIERKLFFDEQQTIIEQVLG